MKAMVEVSHRPTMQEMQARRRTSLTENKPAKMRGMSLPNLEINQASSPKRNSLLNRMIVSDFGETAEELLGKTEVH